jgi:hypothetical protein
MLVLLTRDLFFGSKVTGTAQALGLPVASAGSLDRLREMLTETRVSAVLLDLAAGIAPADVAALVPTGTGVTRLGFGAHVDTAALQAARDAGFELVMPRSKFSAELPQLLRSLTDAASAAG